MRDNVKDVARLVGKTEGLQEPIVEVGSFQVPGQEEYADLRPLFLGREFIGCDMRTGPGVDRIENVHEMTFDDASVGTLLMLDTLEHVANCHRAMAEAHRVLKPGGLVTIVSVMDFAVHLHPSDYWRFTPQAFELLLEPFSPRWVFMQGNPFCPHTVIGFGVKDAPGARPPTGLRALIEGSRAIATAIEDVDYDDPGLLDAYPFHTAHDGYARYDAAQEEIERLKATTDAQAAEIASVRSSLGWRAMQGYRRAREAILPDDSLPGRAYKAVRRALR
jgi:SAM-dependent methyltransferase